MSRSRSKKSRRAAPSGSVPMTQDTPEQVYQRWNAMHGSKTGTRIVSPLEAIKQSSWVYSAVTFICEHIMRTPFLPYKGEKRVEAHAIQKLTDRPNTYGDQNSSSKFRYAYMMELLLHGAVMRILGDMQGFKPGSMMVRPRWQFRVQWAIDEYGRQMPVKWCLNRPGRYIEFTPADNIYHDALYNPLHDFEGLSPLTAALLSVSNDNNINEFASRFFENDGSTGMVLSTDHPAFNQAKADEASKKWKATNSGMENAFGVKFVGFGLKPYNVGSPLDAKMLATLRSFTKEEIVSGIYKVPLDAISAKDGGGDIVIGGPSGGTQASAREAFLINVVQPWAMRYDEDFNRDITWRFDTGIMMRHDFSQNPILERRRLERATAAVQLIDRGVPLNEVIRWLKLEISPQPHGDDWWVKNDHLPARVVLDQPNDEVFKIAVPPVPAVPAVPAPQKKQALEQYVESIVELAGQVGFQEQVRTQIRESGGRLNGEYTKLLGG